MNQQDGHEPRTDKILAELRKKHSHLLRRQTEVDRELSAVHEAIHALMKGNRRPPSGLLSLTREAVKQMPQKFKTVELRDWLRENAAQDPDAGQLGSAIGHLVRLKEITVEIPKRGRIGALYSKP